MTATEGAAKRSGKKMSVYRKGNGNDLHASFYIRMYYWDACYEALQGSLLVWAFNLFYSKSFVGIFTEINERSVMAYSAASKRYLMWLCEKPCTFCFRMPCNEAHHLRTNVGAGMGLKSKDKWAIPCCHTCHSLIHTKYGEKKFFERYGHSVESVKNKASEHWESYQNKGE